MIYFVTNKKEEYKSSINNTVFPDIVILNEEEGKKEYFKKFSKSRILAMDIEATGLDAYKLTPLLYGIGTEKVQFMFDWTINVKPIFEHIKKYNQIILGHNLKYDIKIVNVHANVELERLYDTQIADQRLWMRLGYKWDLASLVQRYCNKVIIKSTRNEFIDADITKFKITTSHLYYLKGDLVDLFKIRERQRYYIKKYKMEFLIYGIEFPLIPALAEAELEGFVLDTKKWLARLEKEKEEKWNLEIEMDEEVRYLRDFKSTNELFKHLDPKFALGGAKYNNTRVKNPNYELFNSDGTTNADNLFGEKATVKGLLGKKGKKPKVILYPNNVNYHAKVECVKIFAKLEEPMITPHETYKVPQLDKTGKVIGGVHQFTIKEAFLQKYLLEKPNSIMVNFIKMMIKHSKLEKSISTYGENFISMINPITGKIHTIFRQCFADTGRFQSGGGDREPDKFNAQNVPAKNDYRNCFTVEDGYVVQTSDYSGAELIVMASHAQDFKLIDISKEDMHSYMATKCWRNIFGYRCQQLRKLFTKNPGQKTATLVEEHNKYLELFKTYTVTKALKAIRTAFKGMTFGTIYGMYSKKAGATLNISKEEGQVVINTIKSELPKTFAMVEAASDHATRYGYVVHNDRTNSRAWFPWLIRKLKGEANDKDHFGFISGEQSAARNSRIQGTQADFVKEATVVLRKYHKKHRYDVKIISWIHDEFVFKVHSSLTTSHNPLYRLHSLYKTGKLFPTYQSITGKTFNSITEVNDDILKAVANRYLRNVEIDVESEVKLHWTK